MQGYHSPNRKESPTFHDKTAGKTVEQKAHLLIQILHKHHV